jgi:predicted nucleotidyltransferase
MAKRARLSKSTMGRINTFAQMVKEQGISVSKVILFGSCAKGGTHADSNIDVAVVSTQFGRDAADEMMMLRKIALKVDSRIEPVPLTPEDLNDTFSTLAQEIKRYGIDMGITA